MPELNQGLGQVQSIYLDSAHFLVFVLFAVAAFGIARRYPRIQGVVLLPLNLYFLSFLVRDWSSAAGLGLLVGATYVIGQLKLRGKVIRGELVVLAIVLAYWAALFLIKDPTLLSSINPFASQAVVVIGISFIMFRCINYIVDIEVLGEHSFLEFVNFVVFFPTLMAGPLARFDDYHADYREPQGPSGADILPALHRIANGFIKKFVFADTLAVWGVFSFGDVDEVSRLLLLIGVLCQLFIIYLDFAGYTDIMIGIGRLMGFRLPENFNRPLSATNIQEFWMRWHMSLTHFIRDYVFTPIVRAAALRLDRQWYLPVFYAAYFLTMMLIALWHQTTWGFFVFGVVQGVALIAYQVYRRRYPLKPDRRPSPVADRLAAAALYSFLSVTVTLWFFGPQKTVTILGRIIGIA